MGCKRIADMLIRQQYNDSDGATSIHKNWRFWRCLEVCLWEQKWLQKPRQWWEILPGCGNLWCQLIGYFSKKMPTGHTQLLNSLHGTHWPHVVQACCSPLYIALLYLLNKKASMKHWCLFTETPFMYHKVYYKKML